VIFDGADAIQPPIKQDETEEEDEEEVDWVECHLSVALHCSHSLFLMLGLVQTICCSIVG